MIKGVEVIDVETARAKAENEAESCLRPMATTVPSNWLRSEYMEAKNCWLFLKAPGISFLPNCEESADAAFVVSKKGKVMSIADHHENMLALHAYLEEISAYLEQRGE